MPHAPLASWADITPLPSPPPAQGAMGVVLAATHRGRRVAVKVFKTALLAAGELERAVGALQAEVTKMARASEGGFNEFVVVPLGLVVGAAPAPILRALGPHAPACIASASPTHLCGLVMRWEDGGTLHELLHGATRAWGAGTAERLQMCAQLASGVAALHAAGVVHGDVKGENVLLSERSATPRPRFADFGLAELRDSAARTRTSTAVEAVAKRGTWPYMAPEMFRWRGVAGLAASRVTDVYALGTLCWEVLTGSVPWEGFTEAERIAALKGGEELPLGTPPLPVDTPAVVKELLRAVLSAEKAARPRAAQLAEALHQAAQAMASGSFDIFLSHAWGGDGRHAPLTTEVYLRLLDAGYRVWLDTAEMGFDMDLSMQNGIAKSGCVVALLSSRYGTKPDPTRDSCLKELRWAREMGKPIVACLADPTPGWFPAASGEVARLVGMHHLFPNLCAAAAVEWRADVSDAEREVLTKAPGALPKVLQLVRQVLGQAPAQQEASVVGAPSGAGAVGGGGGGGAAPPAPTPPLPAPAASPSEVLPLTGHCVAQLRHGRELRGLAVLEGGGHLVSGGYNNLRVWDLATGKNVATMEGLGCKIVALPGGRFATAGGDRATAWSAVSRTRICEYTGHNNSVTCVASLPNNLAASGGNDKTVRIWNADTGAQVATLQGHTSVVSALAVLSDGRLASGSYDFTVRLWDVSRPTSAPTVLQHHSIVKDFAVLDGGTLASTDGKVYLWDVSSASEQPMALLLGGHTGYVVSLAALPRGLLASGSSDKTVRVWSVAARTCVAVLQGHTAEVKALAALPDGRLASGSDGEDGMIRVWELRPHTKGCVLQ